MAQENVTHDRQEVLIARVVGVRTQRVRRAPETLLDRFDVFQLGQSRSLNCSMILAGCGVAEAAKSRISAGTVGENLCDVASGQSGGNESARSRGRSFEGWGWGHNSQNVQMYGVWYMASVLRELVQAVPERRGDGTSVLGRGSSTEFPLPFTPSSDEASDGQLRSLPERW
jgi:hypothetical protein